MDSFYAETIDSQIIRAYQPKKQITGTKGWILCFPGTTNFLTPVVIHRKFTGYRKMFMNFALQSGHVRPAPVEGLLPEFEEEFEVIVSDTGKKQQALNKNIQEMI